MSRYRHFVFTHNNYADTDLEDNIECRYIAYSKEVVASGTPHLQGFISFGNSKTKKTVIKLLPGCHIEVMLGSYDENTAYCSKAGSLVERGERPMYNDNKGRAEKLRWKRNLDLAKSGKLEEIDADIVLRYYSTIKRIAADYAIPPDPCECKGYWIWGPTATGKS